MQIQDLAYFDDCRVQQAKIQPVAQVDLGSGGRGRPVSWGFWEKTLPRSSPPQNRDACFPETLPQESSSVLLSRDT